MSHHDRRFFFRCGLSPNISRLLARNGTILEGSRPERRIAYASGDVSESGAVSAGLDDERGSAIVVIDASRRASNSEPGS